MSVFLTDEMHFYHEPKIRLVSFPRITFETVD